jgi:hypothetical protein
VTQSADWNGMDAIDKKGLKKLPCPKCGRPKLRFEHSTDGVAPDGGSSADRDIRCDACKTEFTESNQALQAAWKNLQSERTPPPVTPRHT